jgi:hypothetical protein
MKIGTDFKALLIFCRRTLRDCNDGIKNYIFNYTAEYDSGALIYIPDWLKIFVAQNC